MEVEESRVNIDSFGVVLMMESFGSETYFNHIRCNC